MDTLNEADRKALLAALKLQAWNSPEERLRLIQSFQSLQTAPTELLGLLINRDPDVSDHAARRFLSFPHASTLPLLLDQLTSTPPELRAGIWKVFNAYPEPLLQQTLNALLSSPRRSFGWEATQHLTGQLRLVYLERMVREGPLSLRGTMLKRLLLDRPPLLMLPLLEESARSLDVSLAVAALEGLSRIGDARVLDLMLGRFFQPDPTIRRATLGYLREMAQRAPERLRPKLLPALSSGDATTRQQGAELLLDTGRQEDVLADILRHLQGLAGWLRTRLLETLRLFGDTLVLATIPLLQHPEEPIQFAALALVETLRDPRLVDPVGRLLIEEGWALRLTACEVLGQLGGERALRWLLQALDDPEARWAAVAAIGRAGAAPALPRLLLLLKDPRVEIRLELLQALAPLAEPKLLPALAALKESDPAAEVRTRAAEVLRDLSARLQMPAAGADQGTSLAMARRTLSPLDRCLALIRDEGASDLHFQAGTPPRMRLNGQLHRCEDLPVWDADTLSRHLTEILDARQRQRLQEVGEVEFGHAVSEVGRFRGNAFRQQQGIGLTFRLIPNVPPTCSDLRLPAVFSDIHTLRRGLVLLAGPAGSGKSSTLAALVNRLNEQTTGHILTVEDPIEFVHPPKRALLSQREVGRHSPSTLHALRSALREDPDVIAIGEIRTPDVLRAALQAAVNGHLVLATFPTNGLLHTLDRILRAFPHEEQAPIRMVLAETLRCISSQLLLPRRDPLRRQGAQSQEPSQEQEQGRVAAFEFLRVTPQAAHILREGKLQAIGQLLQQSRPADARSRDRALQELVDTRIISLETAHSRAERPDIFQNPETTQLTGRVEQAGGGRR